MEEKELERLKEKSKRRMIISGLNPSQADIIAGQTMDDVKYSLEMGRLGAWF